MFSLKKPFSIGSLKFGNCGYGLMPFSTFSYITATSLIHAFLTLSQTSPGFYVCSTGLLKILWEKQKLLVICPFEELYSIFIIFEIDVCKLLSLEESKICCLRKCLSSFLLALLTVIFPSNWLLYDINPLLKQQSTV